MSRDQSQERYDVWTRRQVAYLPIMLDGNLVGYLWGGQTGSAAGSFARAGSGISPVKFSIFWSGKLEETYQLGLKPVEAISYWIGKPEDSLCGGIPADAVLGEARTIQELALRLNPNSPLGEGPWVQDGEYPSGAPADRSEGWGPLVSVPTPTYPDETASPVTYLPITCDGEVRGYLWVSTTDNAAGYLQRTAAGRDGMIASGLWRSRLVDAYEAQVPTPDLLGHIRAQPESSPKLFGIIADTTAEQHAASLADLRQLAEGH
ncbi:hypothetical protein OHB26_06880 [Nocardia sp. NBC_01503]|uniref:hypothetical protein n=1 Tax=Nocardia sp. NBC_01503 TaxID=2975997 RepID=UPI002E7B449A|nr:hypothetical protein [Nocardia sp. NBC_01503]WTL33934.1 hypothetical protein OHB26_06880 [Nocardia sp. NBC_01503]